jgi:hypothetical protein
MPQGKKALLFGRRSKNFCLLGRTVDPTRTPISKSFLVLFCKKELLASASQLFNSQQHYE